MHVWNVLHAAPWKYRTQKIAKNLPSGHHCTTSSGCIFATKTRIDNRNNLLNSNISSTCSQNMANVGPLMAEIGLPVWGTPANLTDFASWLRYCSDVAQRTLTKLCTIFGRLLCWYTIYAFWGHLPPDGILARAKFDCVQVLRSRILAALLHDTSPAGLSQTLRRGTRNGISEFS